MLQDMGYFGLLWLCCAISGLIHKLFDELFDATQTSSRSKHVVQRMHNFAVLGFPLASRHAANHQGPRRLEKLVGAQTVTGSHVDRCHAKRDLQTYIKNK
jgi:hypothetical protein